MFVVLELEVGNGAGREVEGQTWLVRLIKEVPNVDTVGLRNEYDTGTSWRESSTSVVGAVSWSRAEDGVLSILEINLPNSEMEVMNGQEEVGVEWRSFQGKCWSVLLLTVEGTLDVLSDLGAVITSTDCLDGPVDEDEVSLI